MIALQIESTKEFLNLLLSENLYDEYLVGYCEVTTFVSFSTDGRRSQVADDEQEHSDRVSWGELKPAVLGMIESSSTSGTLQLDLFKYRGRDMGSIRIAFTDGRFTLTTGYMQKEFSLDKRTSEDWDDVCQQMLSSNGIVITAL